MKILAATDFSTRSTRALRQAGLLAGPAAAQLLVLHVVDDDQPSELIDMEKREAERFMAEQLAAMPELQGVASRPMVTAGAPFDGILRGATEFGADLIVMGSHRKQLFLDIFVGTTVERVIRKGSFPVLMVSNEAQRQYDNVVVPMDMSSSSAEALHAAIATGLMGGGRATLLHAFVPVAKGKMVMAGSHQSDIDGYIAVERRRAAEELQAFLSANGLDPKRWPIHLEEGEPMNVISRAVSEMSPDLLVMGTRGRPAVLKALISSITEDALRTLNVDILAVPPRKK
jgi:nucleotide-binding universal stress UspA family protein